MRLAEVIGQSRNGFSDGSNKLVKYALKPTLVWLQAVENDAKGKLHNDHRQ